MTPVIPPDESTAYLKLPFFFDPAPLRNALAGLRDASWGGHPNTAVYQGAWRSLALRSVSGAEDDVNLGPTDASQYRDTSILRTHSEFRMVLDAFDCPIASARLLALAPGTLIKEHRDHDLALWDGMARIHVPIATSDAVIFRVNGRRIDMGPGECWYLNANHPHSVVNGGACDRVHLVIDCIANDWLETLLLAHGHSPRKVHKYGDPAIHDDNVEAVMAALEAMGSEASLALSEKLRRQRESAS